MNPEIQTTLAAIQALAALGGMILAGLAWRRGLKNGAAIAVASGKVDATATKVAETLELVNGSSKALKDEARAEGYRQGVLDASGTPNPAPAE